MTMHCALPVRHVCSALRPFSVALHLTVMSQLPGGALYRVASHSHRMCTSSASHRSVLVPVHWLCAVEDSSPASPFVARAWHPSIHPSGLGRCHKPLNFTGRSDSSFGESRLIVRRLIISRSLRFAYQVHCLPIHFSVITLCPSGSGRFVGSFSCMVANQSFIQESKMASKEQANHQIRGMKYRGPHDWGTWQEGLAATARHLQAGHPMPMKTNKSKKPLKGGQHEAIPHNHGRKVPNCIGATLPTNHRILRNGVQSL
jgi:hypothetical protein